MQNLFLIEKSHFRKKFSFLLLSFELLFVVFCAEKGKYAVRGLGNPRIQQAKLAKALKTSPIRKTEYTSAPKGAGYRT